MVPISRVKALSMSVDEKLSWLSKTLLLANFCSSAGEMVSIQRHVFSWSVTPATVRPWRCLAMRCNRQRYVTFVSRISRSRSADFGIEVFFRVMRLCMPKAKGSGDRLAGGFSVMHSGQAVSSRDFDDLKSGSYGPRSY